MKQVLAKSCPSCGERYDADVLFCPRDGTPLASSRKNPAFAGAERDPYVGIELAGQIQLRHLIGIGSMGRVYRAFQAGIERDVAVKVLHRELSSNVELVRRFHREAKVASRLVHPNVVQVLMTGTVPASDPRIGGELYLVMEHLDGMSLLSALAAAGTSGESEALPLPRALHIALQICDAVGEAHAQGIVHRDLKPENVMLVRRGSDVDYVKVLDFGIARLDWGDKALSTQAGLIFGTAKYISPEGAEGHPVGPPADVYSIATMLYQCLAGRAPFEGDSPVALLVQHTHAPPTELRAIARASYVPVPIAQVVMRNLAKKPSERAPDARALGRDLALAVRASGLDPDEIAANSDVLRGRAVVKLASKSRTKSLELSPSLAAQIGGIAASTLESARPPDLDALLPVAGGEALVDASAPRHELVGETVERRVQGAPLELAPGSPRDRASPSGGMLGWSSGSAREDAVEGSSRGAHPSAAEHGAADSARSSTPRQSAPHAHAIAELDVEAGALHDPTSPPSTMQGVASEAHPSARRARLARIVAVTVTAAAMGFVLVLGGRHLGGLSAATASDSLEGHLARARECMSRRAWDAPAGDNVKEVTAQALARWPSDPRVAELRREASERIVADALGRKYAGDPAGALRLAELALELTPSLTTAQHLAAELRAISPTPAGEPPLEVAPALSGAGDPTRRPPLRRGPQDGRPTPPGGQPAPPPTTASKTGSAPAPGSGAAPAPELPPTPPPLPPEPPAALPTASGPWL